MHPNIILILCCSLAFFSQAVADDLKRPPAGIVAEARLDVLFEDAPVAAPPSADMAASALANAAKCEASGRKDDACSELIDPLFLGVKGDLVAIMAAPDGGDMSSCGVAEEVAHIAQLPTFSVQKLFLFPEIHENNTQILDWFAEVNRQGFKPAASLALRAAGEPHGIRELTTTLLLRAPLAGFMLDIVTHKDTFELLLVDPTNSKKQSVHSFPRVIHTCTEKEIEDDTCLGSFVPLILDATLSADNKTLVILLALSDGTHCGIDKTAYVSLPLPAAP